MPSSASSRLTACATLLTVCLLAPLITAQDIPAAPGTIEAAEPLCGTAESDYAPCVARERADSLFSHCCQQYAPEGCQSLCTYENDELTARNALLQAVKSGKCDLKHVSTVLYCASQNQDNRKCCEHLGLADPKLGVGNRCLRFCDPAGEGISSISRQDVTCLFNWNVMSYCAHAGIKLE
uniref:WH2 domain-containing protein n=1 Tax=Panagrellus redivivus TaxID=6233 RepID=A0A7E4UVM9_PANRE